MKTHCTCRNKWGLLFTSDPQLIAKVGQLLVVLAFYVASDGLSVVLGGAVRGAGKQGGAAPVTVASYYLLGLPCAAVLAFVFGLGATGLCLGLLLGSVAMDTGFFFLMWRTDWGEEADRAAERARVTDGAKLQKAGHATTDDVELQQQSSHEEADNWNTDHDAAQLLLRSESSDNTSQA